MNDALTTENDRFKLHYKGQKTAEATIVTLEKKIEHLKAAHNVYNGDVGDEIDMAMANFLNEYPDRLKLKILFERESEGVYKFGTRLVNVKVERGNVVYVKVGGGFIKGEEFIEKYMQTEVERMGESAKVY